MPELAELKITADYINRFAEGRIFDAVRKNPQHKGKEFSLRQFKIKAESRGKELKLILEAGENMHSLMMTMGMSGHFKFTKTGEEKKHSHLMFDSIDGHTLSFVDVRRFGKWKFGDWNEGRGPDPTQNFEAFVHHIGSNLDHRLFRKPIGEVLMNQGFFNGIGNYLRAEILYRADQNPFQPARDAILENGDKILSLCKLIPEWAYVKGGGSIKDWKNPFQDQGDPVTRSSFFLCYGKKSMLQIVDGSGRRLWFDPKWQGYINYNENTHGH